MRSLWCSTLNLSNSSIRRGIYNTVADCYVILKKGKQPKKIRRRYKTLIIIAIVVLSAIWYYFGRILPVMHSIIEERTYIHISKAVDESASGLMSRLTYDDYVIVRTGDDGTVSYIGINSVSMNMFARNMTESVRNKIAEFENSGVTVPFGVFTGITLMSGIGPDCEMRVLSLAVASAKFESSFTSAGINQTLLSVYVVIDVSGEIILPGYAKDITRSTQILVSETVIVGKTPNTYVDL